MSDKAPWVIVGLGNPGEQYAGNRHNVGAMVIGELAGRVGATLRSHKARARATTARLGGLPGVPVVLGIPTTYMNTSGGPVKALLNFFGADPARLVVIHDDLDIDSGLIRLKLGGGEGGHNGLRSVSNSLGTREYYRVRVGIGRPPGRMDPADYVLRDFSSTERAELPLVLDEAADAVEALVLDGLQASQDVYHARH
ncbi:MAG: aminoacyl-tRNA hydrolase [Nostocoides sp.]